MIRRHREKKSWNQDRLAKAARLSRKTVSDLENASRSYGIDSLLESMLALDIDPWTFFGGSARHRPERTIEDEILHNQLDRILKIADNGKELGVMLTELLRRLASTIPGDQL
jgi:transcriptional regulator with XRE-family HTH domain